MKEHYVTNSESETLDVAWSFGKTLNAGAIVALTGNLGAVQNRIRAGDC